MEASKTSSYKPETDLLIIVGNFGSGKTEVSVNLSLHLRQLGFEVEIADLDIVNPYFRCREAKDIMEKNGIRVVVPTGEFHWADLPIVLPEIKGIVEHDRAFAVFDVGGDDMGARLLSSLSDVINDRSYRMLQVVNERRPFTETARGVERIMKEIEEASRLEVSGLISNAHLMEETGTDVILKGLDLCRQVADSTGKTVEFFTAPRRLQEDAALSGIEQPVLWLERHMLPPHLHSETCSWEKKGTNKAPANRPLWGPSREG